MAVKLLCCGDIHLGRQPTRIPEQLGTAADFTPRIALQRTVALAKRLQVNAVVFTGDVADHNNAFFEAYTILSSSIQELIESGISVLAVAGNHDYQVLPALAEELPQFRLLADGDAWQEEILDLDDQQLRVQGRSFTASSCRENPLSNYSIPKDDVPTVALLHCDVDADSRYGPVALSELKAKAPSAWILGHIHKPALLSQEPLIFYAGSLQGMNPGEPGAHGPWLIELEGKQVTTVKQYPLAALRYEQFELPLKDAASGQEIERLLTTAIQEWGATNQSDLAETAAILWRVRLTGRSAAYRDAHQTAANLPQQPPLMIGNVKTAIEKVVVDCQPELNLETLALQNDLSGSLARNLLLLTTQSPPDQYHALLQSVRPTLEEVQNNPAFIALKDETELNEQAVHDLLLQAGLDALDRLLHQKEAAA